MTYNLIESSSEQGQPTEFYDFGIGSDLYNYTSAEDEIVIGAVTYRPLAISRSAITLGAEVNSSAVTVTMPASSAPANLFRETVPNQATTLSIRRRHRTDVNNELVLIFKGIVRSVGYIQSGYVAELAVTPLTYGISRQAPRFTYQGLCNHILYDTGCRALQGSYTVTGNVTAVSGSTLTVQGLDSQADGYYTGGFVQVGTNEFRLIISHTGNNIDLLFPLNSTVLNTNISVIAGCDHTIQTCKNKFNNVANYGGFAFVPQKDIFRNGI